MLSLHIPDLHDMTLQTGLTFPVSKICVDIGSAVMNLIVLRSGRSGGLREGQE